MLIKKDLQRIINDTFLPFFYPEASILGSILFVLMISFLFFSFYTKKALLCFSLSDCQEYKNGTKEKKYLQNATLVQSDFQHLILMA